jgi:predicted component of type VI protein secretion system
MQAIAIEMDNFNKVLAFMHKNIRINSDNYMNIGYNLDIFIFDNV